MKSLEGDPATQWHTEFEKTSLEGVSFSDFKRFLLNLVVDPTNRRLLAYEKWEEARQKPEQKVTVFKAYLEEVEAHLPPMSEEHRANFFLAKLQPRLKDRILSTGNVPKLREEILAMAIMQEKVSERVRRDGGNSSNSKSSGGQNSKGRSLESRVSRPNKPKGGDGAKPPQTQISRGSSKRKADNSNPDHKDDTCFHCGKKGHWSPDCPDKDKPPVPGANPHVGAVSAKKGSVPPTPPKRNRNDSQ